VKWLKQFIKECDLAIKYTHLGAQITALQWVYLFDKSLKGELFEIGKMRLFTAGMGRVLSILVVSLIVS
jgi:hypothetical protein